MNWQGLLAALIACTSLTGCFGSKASRPGEWLNSFRQSAGPTGPNALFIEYALIERPQGDPKIDKEIWSDADEQVIPVENRSLIETNGFRVGRYGNVLPSPLQAMLANPQTELGHRQRRLYFDGEFKLNIGKTAGKCEVQLPVGSEEEGDGKQVLIDAEFGLTITASKDGEEKILLEFTPEVQSSEKKSGGITLWSTAKQSNKLTNLSWRVSVGPDEHLLIGTSSMREETIGHRAFLLSDGKEPKQRILLLKTGRMQNDTKGLSMGKDASPIASNSLVNQASTSRVKE